MAGEEPAIPATRSPVDPPPKPLVASATWVGQGRGTPRNNTLLVAEVELVGRVARVSARALPPSVELVGQAEQCQFSVQLNIRQSYLGCSRAGPCTLRGVVALAVTVPACLPVLEALAAVEMPAVRLQRAEQIPVVAVVVPSPSV